MPHGTFFLSRKTFLVFLVAVQEENGIIHCHTQLQHCSQCLRNIRSLAQENVASKVIENCKSDTDQEQNRYYERSACQFQYYQTQKCCDHYIDRKFFECQVFDVCDNSGHTTDKALIVRYLPHLSDCIHCFVGRCCIIEQYKHHRGITLEKCLP